MLLRVINTDKDKVGNYAMEECENKIDFLFYIAKSVWSLSSLTFNLGQFDI